MAEPVENSLLSQNPVCRNEVFNEVGIPGLHLAGYFMPNAG